MQNNGAAVSFIDAMRQVNDGKKDHYVEITDVNVDIRPTKRGKFFLPPWFSDVYALIMAHAMPVCLDMG